MLFNFKNILIILYLLLSNVNTKLHRRQNKKEVTEKKSQLRIINGRDSPLGELPYIVRMEVHVTYIFSLPNQTLEVLRPLHICTCSQVAPTWTLTAAHCADDVIEFSEAIQGRINVLARTVIRYGAVDDVFNNTSDILKLIKHPSYAKEPVLTNDIALLKTNVIKLRNYGRISAVDYKTLIGLKATIVGFGHMNVTINNKQVIQNTYFLEKPLQVMDVLIKKCEGIWKRGINMAICLAPPCKVQTAMCPGDSGGPLLQSDKILGVNSLGPVADCEGSPNGEPYSYIVGLVTPVSPFLDWIAQHINLVPNYKRRRRRNKRLLIEEQTIKQDVQNSDIISTR